MPKLFVGVEFLCPQLYLEPWASASLPAPNLDIYLVLVPFLFLESAIEPGNPARRDEARYGLARDFLLSKSAEQGIQFAITSQPSEQEDDQLPGFLRLKKTSCEPERFIRVPFELGTRISVKLTGGTELSWCIGDGASARNGGDPIGPGPGALRKNGLFDPEAWEAFARANRLQSTKFEDYVRRTVLTRVDVERKHTASERGRLLLEAVEKQANEIVEASSCPTDAKECLTAEELKQVLLWADNFGASVMKMVSEQPKNLRFEKFRIERKGSIDEVALRTILAYAGMSAALGGSEKAREGIVAWLLMLLADWNTWPFTAFAAHRPPIFETHFAPTETAESCAPHGTYAEVFWRQFKNSFAAAEVERADAAKTTKRIPVELLTELGAYFGLGERLAWPFGNAQSEVFHVRIPFAVEDQRLRDIHSDWAWTSNHSLEGLTVRLATIPMSEVRDNVERSVQGLSIAELMITRPADRGSVLARRDPSRSPTVRRGLSELAFEGIAGSLKSYLVGTSEAIKIGQAWRSLSITSNGKWGGSVGPLVGSVLFSPKFVRLDEHHRGENKKVDYFEMPGDVFDALESAPAIDMPESTASQDAVPIARFTPQRQMVSKNDLLGMNLSGWQLADRRNVTVGRLPNMADTFGLPKSDWLAVCMLQEDGISEVDRFSWSGNSAIEQVTLYDPSGGEVVFKAIDVLAAPWSTSAFIVRARMSDNAATSFLKGVVEGQKQIRALIIRSAPSSSQELRFNAVIPPESLAVDKKNPIPIVALAKFFTFESGNSGAYLSRRFRAQHTASQARIGANNEQRAALLTLQRQSSNFAKAWAWMKIAPQLKSPLNWQVRITEQSHMRPVLDQPNSQCSDSEYPADRIRTFPLFHQFRGQAGATPAPIDETLQPLVRYEEERFATSVLAGRVMAIDVGIDHQLGFRSRRAVANEQATRLLPPGPIVSIADINLATKAQTESSQCFLRWKVTQKGEIELVLDFPRLMPWLNADSGNPEAKDVCPQIDYERNRIDRLRQLYDALLDFFPESSSPSHDDELVPLGNRVRIIVEGWRYDVRSRRQAVLSSGNTQPHLLDRFKFVDRQTFQLKRDDAWCHWISDLWKRVLDDNGGRKTPSFAKFAEISCTGTLGYAGAVPKAVALKASLQTADFFRVAIEIRRSDFRKPVEVNIEGEDLRSQLLRVERDSESSDRVWLLPSELRMGEFEQEVSYPMSDGERKRAFDMATERANSYFGTVKFKQDSSEYHRLWRWIRADAPYLASTQAERQHWLRQTFSPIAGYFQKSPLIDSAPAGTSTYLPEFLAILYAFRPLPELADFGDQTISNEFFDYMVTVLGQVGKGLTSDRIAIVGIDGSDANNQQRFIDSLSNAAKLHAEVASWIAGKLLTHVEKFDCDEMEYRLAVVGPNCAKALDGDLKDMGDARKEAARKARVIHDNIVGSVREDVRRLLEKDLTLLNSAGVFVAYCQQVADSGEKSTLQERLYSLRVERRFYAPWETRGATAQYAAVSDPYTPNPLMKISARRERMLGGRRGEIKAATFGFGDCVVAQKAIYFLDTIPRSIGATPDFPLSISATSDFEIPRNGVAVGYFDAYAAKADEAARGPAAQQAITTKSETTEQQISPAVVLPHNPEWHRFVDNGGNYLAVGAVYPIPSRRAPQTPVPIKLSNQSAGPAPVTMDAANSNVEFEDKSLLGREMVVDRSFAAKSGDLPFGIDRFTQRFCFELPLVEPGDTSRDPFAKDSWLVEIAQLDVEENEYGTVKPVEPKTDGFRGVWDWFQFDRKHLREKVSDGSGQKAAPPPTPIQMDQFVLQLRKAFDQIKASVSDPQTPALDCKPDSVPVSPKVRRTVQLIVRPSDTSRKLLQCYSLGALGEVSLASCTASVKHFEPRIIGAKLLRHSKSNAAGKLRWFLTLTLATSCLWKHQIHIKHLRNTRDIDGDGNPDINLEFQFSTGFSPWLGYGVVRVRKRGFEDPLFPSEWKRWNTAIPDTWREGSELDLTNSLRGALIAPIPSTGTLVKTQQELKELSETFQGIVVISDGIPVAYSTQNRFEVRAVTSVDLGKVADGKRSAFEPAIKWSDAPGLRKRITFSLRRVSKVDAGISAIEVLRVEEIEA